MTCWCEAASPSPVWSSVASAWPVEVARPALAWRPPRLLPGFLLVRENYRGSNHCGPFSCDFFLLSFQSPYICRGFGFLTHHRSVPYTVHTGKQLKPPGRNRFGRTPCSSGVFALFASRRLLSGNPRGLSLRRHLRLLHPGWFCGMRLAFTPPARSYRGLLSGHSGPHFGLRWSPNGSRNRRRVYGTEPARRRRAAAHDFKRTDRPKAEIEVTKRRREKPHSCCA